MSQVEVSCIYSFPTSTLWTRRQPCFHIKDETAESSVASDVGIVDAAIFFRCWSFPFEAVLFVTDEQ